MIDAVRLYVGKDIDVTYDTKRCTHAAECIRNLPAVFDTSRRPWIQPDRASADAIAEVIAKCPSGALHFTRLDGGAAEAPPEHNTIVLVSRGPLHVRGRLQLWSSNGTLIVEDMRLALCRCGQSHNKPFCDNSHRKTGFNDPGAVADGGGASAETDEVLSLTVSTNGPLLVQGAFTLRGAHGRSQQQVTNAELCRCGASGNKPFCDGTHQRNDFHSEETGGN